MHIETVAIKNYKSFLDRQELQFEPGFNLLVGTNNAGKTSILDVLSLDPSLNEPHRSIRTIPLYGGQSLQNSEFEVRLATSVYEMRRLASPGHIFLPLPLAHGHGAASELEKLVFTFVTNDEDLTLGIKLGGGAEALSFHGDDLITGLITGNAGSVFSASITFGGSDAAPQVSIANHGGIHGQMISYYHPYRQRIYRFSAQRRPGSECGAFPSSVLDREATTLPFCINHLQTNDAHGHRQLCKWINRVFPSIRWIQAPPNGGSFQLRCLPLPPEERRDDLSTSLGRMGAGIGNVIAMLYVVLTSREPQVIAIDEPNAFLHPRALRELLAILEAEGKQHQFILTAHSADVLTAVNARSISLLDFDGVATIVKQIGPKDLHEVRGGLADLGIRMTDLHAKDHVLWVEGQTEELVMPQLLRWACPEVAAGTAVLRVERTGTFSTKGMQPAEVASIYERLSSSSALVPPMVCILLDGETRSKKERDAITAKSMGKLRFLDRRMLENYVLHPTAIAVTLQELGCETTNEAVSVALCAALGVAELSEDITEIDCAVALKNLFSELSDSTVEFRKTRDIPTIVSWVLDNDPLHLEPLQQCLRASFHLS